MKSVSSPLLLAVALIAMAILLVGQVRGLMKDHSQLPIDDFVEYWAAGRLNSDGHNPYDPELLLPLEREAGRDTDEAVMMWNPPWTLAIAMPFGRLEPRASQLLWIGLGLGFVLLGSDVLWRLYGGPAEFRWVSWLLALTFLPTLFVLRAGQIGTWIFAGIVLFLWLDRHGYRVAAGASTVLLAIKPHLLYLFWIVLIVRGMRYDRRMLLGGAAAGLAASGIALLFNPLVFHQYVAEITQRPPAQWKSPTLGSLIRELGGAEVFGLTFLPTLLGLVWLGWHLRRRGHRPWDWREELPWLALVSFVTASYGAWPFDLVILLPAAIGTAAELTRRGDRRLILAGAACWTAINVLALVQNLMRAGSFSFLWMAPALLAACALLRPSPGTVSE